MVTRTVPLSILRTRALLLSALFVAGGLLAHHHATAQAPAEQKPRLDVIYVPTPSDVVARMLEMAEVEPDDYLVDLGSGDGRIVVAAARDRGVKKALGVDIDPERVAEARANAKAAGVEDRVIFEQGDLFEKDFSDADVVTMYLLPSLNVRLRPVILDMTPGTRVVSHAFDMANWEPDEHDRVGNRDVYLWIVPAKVAGSWELKTADGNTMTLTLKQEFQKVVGEATVGGKAVELADVTLRGTEFRFSVGSEQFVGDVDDNDIRAVSASGAASGWSATRR